MLIKWPPQPAPPSAHISDILGDGPFGAAARCRFSSAGKLAALDLGTLTWALKR
jgi:hypothetical protein